MRHARGRTRSDFGETGDGQPAEMVDEIAAGLAQAVTPESGDRRLRLEPFDRCCQCSGVEIAGRLTARDHHAQARGQRYDELGREKSPGGSETLYSSFLMTRSSNGAPGRRTTALNGTCRPSTVR